MGNQTNIRNGVIRYTTLGHSKGGVRSGYFTVRFIRVDLVLGCSSEYAFKESRSFS